MILVPPQDLATIWPKVERWIAAAIEEGQGDENLLDVLIAIARGTYGLWYDERFCGVFQVQTLPRQKVAHVLYCGGSDPQAIREAFEQGKTWCREHGIPVIRMWGRAGWERLLGLKRVGVILQVEV